MTRYTKSQAINNHLNLTCEMSGYGHYKISCDHYGKRISTITTNVRAVDNFKCWESDKERRNGYNELITEIISKKPEKLQPCK